MHKWCKGHAPNSLGLQSALYVTAHYQQDIWMCQFYIFIICNVCVRVWWWAQLAAVKSLPGSRCGGTPVRTRRCTCACVRDTRIGTHQPGNMRTCWASTIWHLFFRWLDAHKKTNLATCNIKSPRLREPIRNGSLIFSRDILFQSSTVTKLKKNIVREVS